MKCEQLTRNIEKKSNEDVSKVKTRKKLKKNALTPALKKKNVSRNI